MIKRTICYGPSTEEYEQMVTIKHVDIVDVSENGIQYETSEYLGDWQRYYVNITEENLTFYKLRRISK